MSTPDGPYRLSEAENRRIFAERIVPDLLAGRESQPQPTSVVLLGQQGAGKTRISQVIAQRLNSRGGFVDLDSDLYKPYHPAYAELMTLDDRQMALHVGPDARQWTHQARAYAQEHGLHVLAHDTAGDARFSADLLRGYRESGSRVEVVALGVPRALSDQGVLNRYYEQVQDRGQGRLSVPEKVEAAYTGMLEYADLVDAERLADAVSVYRRGESKPRYANVLNERGEWEHGPRFRHALREARNTPWTPQETRDFLRVQDKLQAHMPADFHGQLDTIGNQARPLLHRETAARWRSPSEAPADRTRAPGPEGAQQPERDDTSQHQPEAAGGRSETSEQRLKDQAPLSLLNDDDLGRHRSRLTTTTHEAQREAQRLEDLTRRDTSGESVMTRLRDQGAAPEVVERARQAAREDRQHLATQAEAAGSRVEQLQAQGNKVDQEIQRRAQLTPQQRQAEHAVRQHIAATQPQARPSAPRIQGPQQAGPKRGRGR